MKVFAATFALALFGCSTTRPIIQAEASPLSAKVAPSVPSVDSIPKGKFAIIGVMTPGYYSVTSGMTIEDAVRVAGGPERCPVCYEAGGDKRLWRLIGDPTIIREGKKIRFTRNALSTVPVRKGDFIQIDHIPL